jgi:hypothetical protein
LFVSQPHSGSGKAWKLSVNMKISVIMIDGNFRENTFGSEYFHRQDFDENDYEVIWVEYYHKANPNVAKKKKIKIITLNNEEDQKYHSSFCFNRGVMEAKGEILVIPDADQIVAPNFLSLVWREHEQYDRLVMYGYRYDESFRGVLKSFDFDELKNKCVLKNPLNYGGCLTIRKKWLLKVNGYEQHPIFSGGFHANGLDLYTRFKNFGLAIRWNPDLKLYHPWHPFTLDDAHEYKIQKLVIEWRRQNIQCMALQGIDANKNIHTPEEIARYLQRYSGHNTNLYRQWIRKFLIRKLDYIISRSNTYKRWVLQRI